jgi:large subunit ribosomal protein L19
MQLSPINIKERQKLDIRSGDTIRVWQRIQEGSSRSKTGKKTRLQAFEGLIIARKHGSEPGATFTIRKISGGIGVELTVPLYSPKIEKIELIKRPKRVRRAKLYYLRERAARQVRKKMKQMKQIGKVVMETPAEEKPEEEIV